MSLHAAIIHLGMSRSVSGHGLGVSDHTIYREAAILHGMIVSFPTAGPRDRPREHPLDLFAILVSAQATLAMR